MKLPRLKNPFQVLKKLRLEIVRLKADNAFLETKLARYERMSSFVRYNIPSEDAARACLMQLRVHGMSDGRGRTGYGVTAFIPEEVLRSLKDATAGDKVAFVRVVADELVRRALAGAWNVNSRGAVSALLFEPLVPGRTPGAIGAIFDTPHGPEIACGRKPGEDRETYSQRQAMQTHIMRLSQAEELDAELMLAQRDSRPLLPREAESDL